MKTLSSFLIITGIIIIITGVGYGIYKMLYTDLLWSYENEEHPYAYVQDEEHPYDMKTERACFALSFNHSTDQIEYPKELMEFCNKVLDFVKKQVHLREERQIQELYERQFGAPQE